MYEGYVVVILLENQPYESLDAYVGRPVVAHVREYDFLDIEVMVAGKTVTRTFYTKHEGCYFEIVSENLGEFMEQYLRDAIQFAEQLAPVYAGDTQITGAMLVLEKREDSKGYNPTHFELTEE